MISGTKGSDEESTEGPAISFEVPKRVEPPRKVPWILIIILAVILLGGIAAIVLLLRKPGLEMPDFHNKPLAEATNTLFEMKLTAAIEFKATGTNTPRTVFDQNPKAKEKIESTNGIKLFVEAIPSSPPPQPTTTVPDLMNRHLDPGAASAAASAAKVKLTLAGGRFNRNPSFIGKVVDQAPKPGEKVAVDSEVSVWMGTTNGAHRIDPRLFEQIKTQIKMNPRRLQP